MKRLLLLICCLLVVACDRNQTPKSVQNTNEQQLKDTSEFSDVNRVIEADKVFLAGILNEKAVDAFAEKKAKTVLNVMKESELSWEEDKHVKAKGLKYFHYPVDAKDREYKDAENMMAVFRNQENYPIVVHCTGANRAAAVWAMYQVDSGEMTAEEASAQLKKVGIAAGAIKYFEGYIEKKQKKSDS